MVWPTLGSRMAKKPKQCNCRVSIPFSQAFHGSRRPKLHPSQRQFADVCHCSSHEIHTLGYGHASHTLDSSPNPRRRRWLTSTGTASLASDRQLPISRLTDACAARLYYSNNGKQRNHTKRCFQCHWSDQMCTCRLKCKNTKNARTVNAGMENEWPKCRGSTRKMQFIL